ncbi:MAG TPA: YdbL family protein [Methylococcaceae bacterium]|nr:YdbL family protein [Methylococcaceae bacterium]
MNKHKHSLRAVLALILCMALAPVAAADLAQAKAAGQVGEQLNGYLGVVQPNAPAEVRALVESINRERRNAYQAIAKKNGVGVDEVARVTAQKVIGQAGPGHYVQTPSGWQRR